MTKEDVMESVALKESFCKDAGLPITVFENPYFMDRLETLDDMYGSLELFEQFCAMIDAVEFEYEEDYFEYIQGLIKTVTADIQSMKKYEKFLGDDVEKEHKKCKKKFSRYYTIRQLYTDENDGAQFVSLRMPDADFHPMHFFAPEIFDFEKSWAEYMGGFTSKKFLQNSKYIKEAVLSNCGTARQKMYGYITMTYLLNDILDNYPNLILSTYIVDSDEILLKFGENGIGMSVDALKKYVSKHRIGKHTEFKVFKLHKIYDECKENSYGWARKDCDGDGIEFYHVNHDIYNQVVKLYRDEEITDNDLVFTYNHMLAKFLKRIEADFENIF